MSSADLTQGYAPTAKEPLANVLERAVVEMRELTSLVNQLETLVGQFIVADSFSTTNSVYEFQKLDLLRQNIGGIADFFDEIRRLANPDWTVDATDAAKSVKLAGLSERLRGSAAQEENAADPFELFGDSLPKVA